MITTLLTAVLWLVINSLLNAMPAASLPPMINNGITQVSGYLSALATLLPIFTSTLLAVIGLMITAELAVAGYKAIMWFIHRIPGQGGGSTS